MSTSSGRVDLQPALHRKRQRRFRNHSKYTQIFNSLGIIETGTGLVCAVLAVIAIASDSKLVLVPCLAWVGSILAIATGLVGLFTDPESENFWVVSNVILTVVTIVDALANSGVTINRRLNDLSIPKIDNGVVAAHIIIAYLFVLLAFVCSIHCIFACLSIAKKKIF